MKIKPSFIPAIIWLTISTILLTIPGSDLPSEDWLSKIYFDKWVHIGMFALMVLLWCWALLRVYPLRQELSSKFIIVALSCLTYGIAMEFVQKYFIPMRSFDLGDIAADAVGCGVGLIYSWMRYVKK